MKSCVIYLRVSREKEGEKELSIDSQLEQCQRKAEREGAEVLRVFMDRDKTGRNDRRQGFQDAMAFCDTHSIDYFVTWSTSRFARNVLEAKKNKLRLSVAGTKVLYVTTTITDTEDGYLQESIHELFDDYYSLQISRDTKRSMAQNAKDGYFTGGRTPYGYSISNHPLNERRKTLMINNDEADIVKEIFQSRISGIGAKSIADNLNHRGITVRGKLWGKSMVTAILRNQKMIGQTVFGKTNANKVPQPQENWIVTDSHEAIIDRAAWDTVQSLMDGCRTPGQTGSPHSTWLFTGMIRCGVCGDKMKSCSGKGRGKRYYYYNCASHLTGTGCKKNTIRADLFDAWLTEQIGYLILTPDNLASIASEVNTSAESWAKEKKTAKSSLLKEKRSLETKNERLYQCLEDPSGPLSMAELAPRLRENVARLNMIKKEIDSIDHFPLPNYPKITADDLSSLMMGYLTDAENSPKERRKFIAGFIKDISFKDGQVYLEYKPESLLDPVSARFPAKERWLLDLGSNQGQTD